MDSRTGDICGEPVPTADAPAGTKTPATLDLKNLDRLVGEYVHIDRPRTSLEAKAYGPGMAGGSGLVIGIHPQEIARQSYGGETESLVGRRVDFDYGMSVFVTADATVTVDHAAAIAQFLATAMRQGANAMDVLAQAAGQVQHHAVLPADAAVPDLRAMVRDLDAAVEFQIGDSDTPWIEGQPPPSVEVRPVGGGAWTIGRGRILYRRTGAWQRDPELEQDFEWPRDEALAVARTLVAGEARR
ncbi:hypothetical protein Ga0074812_1688 [Parafrankia irregularis]|uniref:Uncharacterized protein n=1 Tax=Parafrankia irregularis TaxID=795642 RepID=A0A0S4R0B7_9ACTN|nr:MULTISPECIES: hypothetical protein [Parafrankia]MBE3206607.1 hypothetical protein [Parafrankia sp. CH37]MBE3206729.1 hypothetical protein [Parafrankia sp. CH37]CUU61255.1 hypothetical protein Ga0074812_1688 [Parafrankia irregularis]